ncbi:hypothetical protein QBC43DRAFT_359753 [Cladorrhinum sp. PSN259]|nr:hypothetical protein QBC43DRAFT_359753 [Cladorrhinum sp. PSN259]
MQLDLISRSVTDDEGTRPIPAINVDKGSADGYFEAQVLADYENARLERRNCRNQADDKIQELEDRIENLEFQIQELEDLIEQVYRENTQNVRQLQLELAELKKKGRLVGNTAQRHRVNPVLGIHPGLVVAGGSRRWRATRRPAPPLGFPSIVPRDTQHIKLLLQVFRPTSSQQRLFVRQGALRQNRKIYTLRKHDWYFRNCATLLDFLYKKVVKNAGFVVVIWIRSLIFLCQSGVGQLITFSNYRFHYSERSDDDTANQGLQAIPVVVQQGSLVDVHHEAQTMVEFMFEHAPRERDSRCVSVGSNLQELRSTLDSLSNESRELVEEIRDWQANNDPAHWEDPRHTGVQTVEEEPDQFKEPSVGKRPDDREHNLVLGLRPGVAVAALGALVVVNLYILNILWG